MRQQLWTIVLLAAALHATSPAQEPPDINLAQDKPYAVTTPYPDPYFLGLQKAWPDTNNRELTDGVFGTPSTLAAFTGYLRCDRRVIVVDLGSDATIRRVLSSFFQNKGWGIYFPQEVTFHLSSDGVNWAFLGRASSQILPSVPGALLQRYEVSGFEHVGRYIRVEIPTDVYVFIDEIQAWGQPGVTPGATWPEAAPLAPAVAPGYPRAGKKESGKASQQVLIFNGYYKPDNLIPTWTAEDFKPYVTYVDTQGTSRDSMFDGFLFLPLAKAPSGRDYGSAAGPSNKVDWEYYIGQTFDRDNQLAALERAVEIARRDLKDMPEDVQKPKRLKVTIAIPYPSPLQADFGDVNGDGISENFNHDLAGTEAAAANRAAAVKWYIDEVLARWQAADFKQLELSGFYWYGENVKFAMSPAEPQVMAAAAAYVHEKGLTINWIPYVFAEGFRDWQQLGFDVANMQPNYMFQTVAVQRLPLIAALARQYGTGIEIELDERILQINSTGAAARAKYVDYLNSGATEGYMHAFTNWYQQVKALLKASRSPNPEVRRMYDLAYMWIKGAYVAPATQ